jgi:LuxR family maltose regulon positive regulatory protein
LRYRLRRSRSASQSDLHNRASQWFEENNFMAEAVQHAIAAQNWDRVAQILTEVNSEMLNHGETTTLVRWYGAIPREVLLSNPKLCFDYCWPLLLTGHFEEAADLLAHVEQMAQDIPPFLGEILTAQAYLARVQGDHALMVERSQRARALLPKESVASRALVAINLGLAYWHMGQMEATEEVLPEAIEASQATGNHYGLMTAIILQARVLAVRGQLRQAAELSRQAIEQGGQLPINALAHLDMCALHYEWNQLAESENYLMRAFDLSRRGQNEEFEVGCWMMLSRLRLAQGDFQAAQEALTKGQAQIDSGTIPLLTASRFETAKLRLALAQDDASAILKLKSRMADDTGSHNFCRFTNLAKAKLLLAQNQHQQAADYLANLAQKAGQNGWRYSLFAIRAYQALAAENLERAVHFLEEALPLARPEGFMRTFVDLGAEFVPYLKEAARCGVEPAYMREILSAIQGKQGDQIPVSRLAEPLSERELEVLRLVVAGLSNREIAQDLVISLGTAKTHIHNIYGKLEVSNRAQAIARAREFELV